MVDRFNDVANRIAALRTARSTAAALATWVETGVPGVQTY